MIPYVLIILIPYCAFFLCRIMRSTNGKTNRITLNCFFAVFIFLLCFRGITVGNDLVRYKYLFNLAANCSFKDLFSCFLDEYAYYAVNWIISRLTDNFQVVLIVFALFFQGLPLLYLYKKETCRPLFVISLFVAVCPFAMYFSGLSQTSAMFFSIPIYYCCKKKKVLYAIVIALVASLFHQSALLLLVFYPVYRMKIRRIHLALLIPLFFVVFKLKDQIFLFALRYVGKYIMYNDIGNNSSYSMLILFFLITFFCFFSSKDIDFKNSNDYDEDFVGLRNIMLLIVAIQCFAPISHMVMRLNYYFLPFLPIAFTKSLDRTTIVNKLGKDMISLIVTLFFTIYFLAGGIDADNLKITPYVFCWEFIL